MTNLKSNRYYPRIGRHRIESCLCNYLLLSQYGYPNYHGYCFALSIRFIYSTQIWCNYATALAKWPQYKHNDKLIMTIRRILLTVNIYQRYTEPRVAYAFITAHIIYQIKSNSIGANKTKINTHELMFDYKTNATIFFIILEFKIDRHQLTHLHIGARGMFTTPKTTQTISSVVKQKKSLDYPSCECNSDAIISV